MNDGRRDGDGTADQDQEQNQPPAADAEATAPAVHATTLAFGGRGVALRGPSGSGKSDLALRLMDRGWCLVADDYTCITGTNGRAWAHAPPALAGKMEVRGLGILEMPYLVSVPLVLCCDLVPAAAIARLPQADYVTLAGCRLPLFRLCADMASAPIRLEQALARLGRV